MNCNVIQDLLPLYVDGVLSEDSKALVEEHLNSCPSCAEALAALKTELPKPTQPDISAKQAINALSGLIKTRVKWGAVVAVLLTVALIGTGRFAFRELFIMSTRYVPTSAIQYELTRTEAGRIALGFEVDPSVSVVAGGWEGGTDYEDGQMVLYCAPQMPRLRWPFGGNPGDYIPMTLATPSALEAAVQDGTICYLEWWAGSWPDDDDRNGEPLSKIYLGWGDDKKVIWQASDPLPPLCTPEQQNWIRHFDNDVDQSREDNLG